MGTSINLPTPAGGDWTDVKREINSLLGDAVASNAQKLISNVIGAAGVAPGAVLERDAENAYVGALVRLSAGTEVGTRAGNCQVIDAEGTRC